MVSSHEEFGGYLPLELPPSTGELYSDSPGFRVQRLNSGRATFYFAALNARPSKVFLPYFTCADTAEPFKKLGIAVDYYLLDDNLLPKDVEPKRGELVLWTNYYGNASKQSIQEAVKRYENQIIVDNCHAFFSEPVKGALTSYSTRKFIGVSDGAYLVGNNVELPNDLAYDESHSRLHHLTLQIELGVNAGYPDSLLNEISVGSSYLRMSRFTRAVLSTIDYSRIQRTRRENFLRLHERLAKNNSFELNLASKTHMYYPFMFPDRDLRRRLVDKKVFSPQWWSHVPSLVPSDSIEERLSSEMVMLPIDQRYRVEDMEKLAEIVTTELKARA